MSRKGLVTMGVASMLAGERFLLLHNLHDQQMSWPVAFALWIAFGIATAFAGDAAYNNWLPSAKNPTSRFLMLWAIITVMVVLTYLFSRVVFALV